MYTKTVAVGLSALSTQRENVSHEEEEEVPSMRGNNTHAFLKVIFFIAFFFSTFVAARSADVRVIEFILMASQSGEKEL